MAKEIAALKRTNTWDRIPRPPSVVPITCKWVYKIKTHSNGSIERFKARLVAHGFQQQYGRDYNETFAPVAHQTIVHSLIAVASVHRWTISQLDGKNAFLHGELHEEVYMHPPSGYCVPDGHVCRLRHSLYGLKQAPRAWFERFTSIVTVVGFAASQNDPSLFVHTPPPPPLVPLFFFTSMICSSRGMIMSILPLLRSVLVSNFICLTWVLLVTFLGLRSHPHSTATTSPRESTFMIFLIVRVSLLTALWTLPWSFTLVFVP
jgi:hypothetical protein